MKHFLAILFVVLSALSFYLYEKDYHLFSGAVYGFSMLTLLELITVKKKQ